MEWDDVECGPTGQRVNDNGGWRKPLAWEILPPSLHRRPSPGAGMDRDRATTSRCYTCIVVDARNKLVQAIQIIMSILDDSN